MHLFRRFIVLISIACIYGFGLLIFTLRTVFVPDVGYVYAQAQPSRFTVPPGSTAQSAYQDVVSNVIISGNVGVNVPAIPSPSPGITIGTNDWYRVTGATGLMGPAPNPAIIKPDLAGNSYWAIGANNGLKLTNTAVTPAIYGYLMSENAGTSFGLYDSNGNARVITSSSGNYVSLNPSSGNVGIGTTNPGYKLDVNGGIRAYLGGTTGYAALVQGSSGASGYVEWIRPDAATRIAFLGWANGGVNNLGLNLENGAAFNINGGNVGIGRNDPQKKLDVVGNIGVGGNSNYNWTVTTSNDTNWGFGVSNASSNYFTDARFSGTGDNTRGFRVLNTNGNSVPLFVSGSGNVGIGTTSPGQKLDVNGNIQVQFNGAILSSAGRLDLQPNSGLVNIYNGSFAGRLDVWNAGANNISLNSSGNTFFNGGNVGIGTTSPDSKLYVNGGVLHVNGSGDNYFQNGDPYFIIDPVNVSDSAGYIKLQAYDVAGSSTGPRNIAINQDGGNVGIGTTSPTYQLTLGGGGLAGVFGVDNGNLFSAKNASGSYEGYLWPRWNDNVMYLNYGSAGFNIRNNASTTTMFMTNAGNVGIGTTNPQAKLDVFGPVIIRNPNPGIPGPIENYGIQFSPNNSVYGNAGIKLGDNKFFPVPEDHDINLMYIAPRYHVFYTSNCVSGPNCTRFQINDNGNVYICNSGCAYSYAAFDIAENMETIPDENTQAGDIVGAAADHKAVAIKASVPYQKELLGIISTNPGVLGGAPEWGEKEVVKNGKPLSLAGRVPTKVSTINGPIKVGDYITSSTIPGLGMKATKAGATVGKALEEFDPANGKGEVISCPAGSPEGVVCGKITVFVNVSNFDPDTYLTSTEGSTISSILEGGKQKYQVKDALGNVVTKIGQFAESVVGSLRAGVVQAEKLVVGGVDVMERLNQQQKTIESQQRQIDQLKAEVEELKARL